MNKVTFIGYATRNATLTETSTGVKVSRFNIAVSRSYTDANGERKTDFFPVVAFRSLAEIVGRYVHRGSRVCVCGCLESRTYEDADGKKAVIEIIAQDIEFLDNRKGGEQSDNEQTGGGQVKNSKQDFQSFVDELADSYDIPF